MKMNNVTLGMLDQKTHLLELLLLRIAAAAEKHDKPYYIGGGFAIDLTFNAITRPHEDIDFYPMEADTDWWKGWSRSQGFEVSKDDDMQPLTNAFSVEDRSGGDYLKTRDYLVDVYPVTIGKNGEISMAVEPGTREVWEGMLTIRKDRGLWPGKSWSDVRIVTYNGQTVCIENYKTVLKQKETFDKIHGGGTITHKHLHDFERAGIKPTS
jgi:hypothetical protein